MRFCRGVEMADFYVIHSYNYDVPPDLLSSARGEGGYQIYRAYDSLSEIDEKNNNIIYTPNCGHSLINFFTFIVDNYENLPDSVGFLKSNMLLRHIDHEYWCKVKDNTCYTPLWNEPNFHSSTADAYSLKPGTLLERNNSWYIWEGVHSYFTSYNQMLDFLFKNVSYPEWIEFAPGGCYIVEKKQMLKYPKSFYLGIIVILEYEFFPSESWILERMLHSIWVGTYEIQAYVNDYDSFLNEIIRLPDLSEVKNPNTKFSSKLTRFLSKN
jgi:hypothetical protein